MTNNDRKRRMLVAFACGVAFALTRGTAKQIVLGAILLSVLLALIVAGWRLWRMNGSLQGTIKQLETGNPNANRVEGSLFPAISNRALAMKWVGVLLTSAVITAVNPSTKILAGILMAIIVGVLVDGILFLRARSTARRLKGYATVLSRVAGNAAPSTR